MRSITLTTDFGLKDGFVGALKGVISSINPKAGIIDISHEITSMNVKDAAYVIASSYSYFPQGTIHVVVVDPGVGSKRRIILVKTNKYVFLAPDNGVLSFCLKKEKVKEIIEVKNKKYFLDKISCTFHGRDIFAPVSAYLSLGMPVKSFGTKCVDPVISEETEPVIKETNKGIEIKCKIIYEDKFGNIITNMSKDIFDKIIRRRSFMIRIGKRIIGKINSSYSESRKGELLAVWGSSDFMEISLREGSASEIIGKKPIIIKLNK